jgi:hypothetical protein
MVRPDTRTGGEIMYCKTCNGVFRNEYKISAVLRDHLCMCLDCSESLIDSQAKRIEGLETGLILLKEANLNNILISDQQISDQSNLLRSALEGLKRGQYAPTEDSCEIDTHEDVIDENDDHHNSCYGCGRYRCERCNFDCWLSKLIKDIEEGVR